MNNPPALLAHLLSQDQLKSSLEPDMAQGKPRGVLGEPREDPGKAREGARGGRAPSRNPWGALIYIQTPDQPPKRRYVTFAFSSGITYCTKNVAHTLIEG